MSDAAAGVPAPAAPTTVARSSPAAPAAAVAPPRYSSRGELRQAILGAILAERTRKAAKRAAGLPDSDSSDSSDDEDGVAHTKRTAANKAAAAAKAAATLGDSAPASSACVMEYGTSRYWDARYSQTSGTFDWYVDHEQLLPLMREFGQAAVEARQRQQTDTEAGSCATAASAQIAAASTAATPAAAASLSASASAFSPASVRLLDVGCGNSGLAESLYKSGWTDQTHIDISGVCVSRMLALYHSAPSNYGRWLPMDATAMSFADASFDLILEKGTIDALDCSADSDRILNGILAECARVLTAGGVAIIVTHGGPRLRLPALTRAELGWTVHTRPLAYSPRALLIRKLRARLQGLPLSHATTELLAQCTAEVHDSQRHMQADLDRAQACIARVEAEAADDEADDAHRPDDDPAAAAAALREEAEAFSPATSNICFAYCCVKHRDRGDKHTTNTAAEADAAATAASTSAAATGATAAAAATAAATPQQASTAVCAHAGH